MIRIILLTFLSFYSQALSLSPVNSSPKMSCMAMIPQCMGDTSNTMPSDHCVQCQYIDQNYLMRRSITTPYPITYPWWYGYGQYQYPNFNYPGAWYNGGLSNEYYQGPGNMAAGKPNIYIHGLKENTQLDFVIKYDEKSNELASMPIHNKEDGWRVRINKDKSLNVSGNDYSYLYYDYKFDSNPLQDEKGFCGENKEIYRKMVSTLVTMKYKQNEIADFENYWAFKIPKGEFCVFPQTHDNLQSIAAWNSSIQPEFFKRILFVLIQKDQLGFRKNQFTKVPSVDWNPMSGVFRNIAAAKKGLQIHEWGIAFLTK